MGMVLDELGLVQEGGYLTLYFPCLEAAIVFRVRSRENRGFEVIDYGPLPIASGTSLPTYEGTVATAPADGVLPARSYTREAVSFPAPDWMRYMVFDQNDVWRLSRDDKDRIFHVRAFVHPPALRVEVRIPKGVPQYAFQRRRVTVGVDKVGIGATRGSVEAIHFPDIQTGYRFGNDAHLDLRTFVRFVYGEYVVEIPKSPEVVFDVLQRRIPSHWITLPVTILDEEVRRLLVDIYRFPVTPPEPPRLFKLYRADERDRAMRDYAEILRHVAV